MANVLALQDLLVKFLALRFYFIFSTSSWVTVWFACLMSLTVMF